MTDITPALRALAGPIERVKPAITRAAQAAGLSWWRTHDLWYGRAVLKPREKQQILDALAEKQRQEAEARHELATLRTRLASLRQQVASLERRLEENNPDLDFETPDFFSRAAG